MEEDELSEGREILKATERMLRNGLKPGGRNIMIGKL